MLVREVMTLNPIILNHAASTQEAAQHMRDAGVGDVLVHQDGRLLGIITDRDIVVRVVADGKSPELTTLGDCCSEELHTLEPDMDAEEAVATMREFAIRRIPVVEQGQVVGIVSIGDLAIERDEHSALADISAEAPNT
ncbi:MAG: CBS domain-containing protein [Thioalkalivibrio sp.]|nr:MAG: CBS domain-containing protein [Thioalkalivibrio sp.]